MIVFQLKQIIQLLQISPLWDSEKLPFSYFLIIITSSYFERRMMQFCARRPSMTESSLTFRVLTQRSSMEPPVSFCRTETTGCSSGLLPQGGDNRHLKKTKQHQFDLSVRQVSPSQPNSNHTLEETFPPKFLILPYWSYESARQEFAAVQTGSVCSTWTHLFEGLVSEQVLAAERSVSRLMGSVRSADTHVRRRAVSR